MAGSDDDDSSDDDDLFLTKAPTFGSTKRTQGRDENRLLDFLDDCVECEETRLTSRRRMEEFERRSTKAAVADDVPRDGDENGGAASSSSPARNYTDADVDRMIRGTTTAERERRKRRLRDAADGLREGDDAPFAQDDDDDEARRRRREARTADITGRSVGLGTRRTLGTRRKRTRRGDAAKALAAMIRRREAPWAARLRRAVNASLLPLFLRNKSLGRSLSSRDGASKDDDGDDESSSALPATVWEWLWDTANAGERCGTLLSEGACETLVDLLERGHAPPFKVEDLPRRFRRACGYAYKKDDDDEEDATKKVETEPPKRRSRRNEKKDEEKEKEEDKPTPSDEDDNVDVDPLIVRHCLLSWRAALARAPAATSDAEDVEESLETLLVASLDPCFVGGHGLTDSLQNLLLNLIERVRTSDDHDWTDATARRLVLGRVVPLLTTPNDDDGADDSSPWLSLALLVRTVPFHDASGEVRGAALALASRVAEFALYHCVRGDADDVDLSLSADELWRRAGVPSLPRRRRRRRLCALAAVGLDAVVRRRNDPPRLYATLVVAVACARFGNAAPGDDDDRAADAADLRTLEDACARAKKSIPSVLANEHFRRAKELLVWTASTLRFWRRELGANDDEDENPTKVQSDLRGFATTTTTTTTRDETET